MNFQSLRLLAILSSVGLIVAAVLPWGTISSGIFSMSKTGIEGDGIFTAGLGAIALIVSLSRKPVEKKSFAPLLAILAVLVGVVIFIDWDSFQNSDPDLFVQIGSGVYLTILAAIVLAYSGLAVPVKD